MATVKEVYKCKHCGNIAEILHGGSGKLICCGEAMELQEEKTADKSTEKHVPVIEEIDGGYRVTVGSTEHPMAAEHYVEWIEFNYGEKSGKKYFKPGEEPVAEFLCGRQKDVSAREYCNVHGLWKS